MPNAVGFMFGAKSAHEPKATARALAEGRPPDAGRVGKDAKLPCYITDEIVFTLFGVTPFGVTGHTRGTRTSERKREETKI